MSKHFESANLGLMSSELYDDESYQDRFVRMIFSYK